MKFELSVGVVEIFPFCVFPYSIKRIPSTYLSFGHLINIIKTLITVGVRHRKVKWKRITSRNVIIHPYKIGNEVTSLTVAAI